MKNQQHDYANRSHILVEYWFFAHINVTSLFVYNAKENTRDNIRAIMPLKVYQL